MYYTDDPVADAERYAADQEAALELLPICSECGNHIQNEEAYCIGGILICKECMADHLIDIKEVMG